jgi:DNA-binding transcriptional ArsR family regulator
MRQLASPHDHVLTYAEADAFARVMQVLSQPGRVQLLSMLLNSPDGMMPIRMAEQLRISEQQVYRHMRVLLDDGFIVYEKRGKPYRAAPEALRYVADFLAGGR